MRGPLATTTGHRSPSAPRAAAPIEAPLGGVLPSGLGGPDRCFTTSDYRPAKTCEQMQPGNIERRPTGLVL